MKIMEEQTIEHPEHVMRRGLLKGIVYGLAPLLGGTLIASIGEYLLANPEVDDSGWADAGDISDLKTGAPEEISFARNRVDGWKVRNEKSAAWIVLDEKKNVTAFSPPALIWAALITGRQRIRRSSVRATDRLSAPMETLFPVRRTVPWIAIPLKSKPADCG